MKRHRRWTALALGAAGALGLLAGACSEDSEPIDPGEDEESAIVATVLDGSAGLAGVTVRLFADGGTTALRTVNATTTAGVARFEGIAAGSYEVEVTVPSGFEMAAGQVARKDVAVAAGGTAAVSFVLQEIVVQPTTGEIRALVADGPIGIGGVTVTLFAAGGSTALDTETTDANGFGLFQQLNPGDYDVEITLPADHELAPGESARKEVSVTAGARSEVAFELEGPGTVDIFVGGTSFSDDDVTIEPGTTVRWIWSNGSHTVTPTGHSEWVSTDLNSAGDTLVHTFDGVGTFPYHCIPHQSLGMTGIVRVQN